MRSSVRAVLVGFATVGFLALWGTAMADTPNSEALQVGKQRYMKYCATCHGPNATGDGIAASTFAKKPPNLTLLSKNNGGKFPTMKIVNIVKGDAPIAAHGNREMPVWGEIVGSDPTTTGEYAAEQANLKILSIASYLESIQQK